MGVPASSWPRMISASLSLPKKRTSGRSKQTNSKCGITSLTNVSARRGDDTVATVGMVHLLEGFAGLGALVPAP